ncbi:dynein light chain 1,cytoplasmic [Roseibium sp. TrichSKD4]|uniref:hypothetical protein n=1 Tax=Roseibium sp. TrichSKD4 TaxID=744980 RepID=UPI0001E571E0|nr:hypothetical protein [Roseibium sp. TrichSKD4]EFO29033.1 dynein light chain 1,cytoplasmic [Roseibium sp. TrichSKD4]
MPSATPFVKRAAKLGCVAAFSVFLVGCQNQNFDDFLSNPTPSFRSIPQTYNTRYDCRSFNGPGWKGTVGGKYAAFGENRNVTRVGCFKTLPECKTFLGYISGMIQITIYSRCQEIGA